MNSNVKTAIFWVVIICVAVLLWAVFSKGGRTQPEALSFSAFMQEVEAGKVDSAAINSVTGEVSGKYKGTEKEFRSSAPTSYDRLYDRMLEKGVKVTAHKDNGNQWVQLMVNAIPIILLLGFWVFMMRQMQSGGNKALSFGKSRARLHSSQQKKVTFKDVAGVEEAKEELQEIIEFLREPQKFQKLGGRIPKGVLLIGSPGTGKTLLARAIAGEANVPFFSISGSDFVEMFVGVGASRVRDLFEQGKKNAPCIVFIDEIDAVGRHRGAGLGGGHDEREQTLLRPGRFDRRVVVDLPDVRGREAILKVHTKKIPLGDDVELSVIARGTPRFSGADLANLVNEAALIAARQNRKVVTMHDFEMAKDKVIMGVERKSRVTSDEEKKHTAFHEAGHALVAAMIPEATPLHKVTIIPRGMALGLTTFLPEADQFDFSKVEAEAQIAVSMGGRVADELFCNMKSAGASSDIEKATDLARRMVCDWGMSDLGPMSFGKREEQIFLGREIAQHRDYSEATAIRIDDEIRRFVGSGYDRAKSIIEVHREAMVRIAEALLDREVLDAAEVRMLIEGVTLPAQANKPPTSTGTGDAQPAIKSDTGRISGGLLGGERPQPA